LNSNLIRTRSSEQAIIKTQYQAPYEFQQYLYVRTPVFEGRQVQKIKNISYDQLMDWSRKFKKDINRKKLFLTDSTDLFCSYVLLIQIRRGEYSRFELIHHNGDR